MKQQGIWTISDVLVHADLDMGLYMRLPKHAELYGYRVTPVTPEKALVCLLGTGEWALDEDETERL